MLLLKINIKFFLSLCNKILKPLNTSGINGEAAKVLMFAVNSKNIDIAEQFHTTHTCM